jgi:hypothetical protein
MVVIVVVVAYYSISKATELNNFMKLHGKIVPISPEGSLPHISPPAEPPPPHQYT